MNDIIVKPCLDISPMDNSVTIYGGLGAIMTFSIEEAELLALELIQAIHVLRKMPGERMVRKYIDNVCDHYGIKAKDLVSPSRKRPIVEARSILAYLIRQNTGNSLSDIGKLIGRDHATVISAVKNVTNWCSTDKDFKSLVDTLAIL
jgi:chromosomal replication initiation ATPase DnaA